MNTTQDEYTKSISEKKIGISQVYYNEGLDFYVAQKNADSISSFIKH
jgi:NMD protein affecting ribosome stability and mRNA decay